MEIGVQTKGLYPERNAAQVMALIGGAGFRRIDFNIDTFLLNSDVYAGKLNAFFDQETEQLIQYFAPLKAAMEAHKIKASQMHAPYPVMIAGRDSQNAYMRQNVIPKSLAIAAYLGIEWVVVHPIKLQYSYGIKKEREENIAFFQSLIPLMEQYQVKVCLENLYEGVGKRITEGVCSMPEDAVYYIDTLNEMAGREIFGFCLDTGHLQLAHRDPYEYILTVGKRIKALHLHENDGIGDQHQMPYSFGNLAGDGQDWNRVLQGLKEISFDGTLSFETYPCMNSFPDALAEQVLDAIYAVGSYWREQITGQVVS